MCRDADTATIKGMKDKIAKLQSHPPPRSTPSASATASAPGTPVRSRVEMPSTPVASSSLKPSGTASPVVRLSTALNDMTTLVRTVVGAFKDYQDDTEAMVANENVANEAIMGSMRMSHIAIVAPEAYDFGPLGRFLPPPKLTRTPRDGRVGETSGSDSSTSLQSDVTAHDPDPDMDQS